MNRHNTNINLVSVIIPVYNDQSGIDTCIEAIAEQSWPHDRCEVIVVDNGSNPPISMDTMHGDFVRLVCCTTPGSYAARNAGIAAARGDVLAFTDADCQPDRNWISAGVAALEDAQGLCIIGGEVTLSLSQNPTTVERYQHLAGFMQRENIERLGFTVTANLFATHEQVERIGPFDEKLLSGGDREWSWRASRAGYSVRYAANAAVRTSPRTTLAGAIRQTRRTTGGRRALRQLGVTHVTDTGLRPHRSLKGALRWVLTHPELTPWQRGQVLVVASILKIVQWIEMIRLSMGRRSERR